MAKDPILRVKMERPLTSIELTRALAKRGILHEEDLNNIVHVGIEMQPGDMATLHVAYLVDRRILDLAREDTEKQPEIRPEPFQEPGHEMRAEGERMLWLGIPPRKTSRRTSPSGMPTRSTSSPCSSMGTFPRAARAR